jgi:hypothetical protein
MLQVWEWYTGDFVQLHLLCSSRTCDVPYLQIINCRLAMLGFALAQIFEYRTGMSMFEQARAWPVPTVATFAVCFLILQCITHALHLACQAFSDNVHWLLLDNLIF